MNDSKQSHTEAAVTRRSFLKNTSTAVAGGALLGALPIERFALGASPGDTIRIALVGAGGRGSGAAQGSQGKDLEGRCRPTTPSSTELRGSDRPPQRRSDWRHPGHPRLLERRSGWTQGPSRGFGKTDEARSDGNGISGPQLVHVQL